MPASSNWQKARAKTRQPYLPKLVVVPSTPCHFCTHVRSSHSMLVLQAECRVAKCDCPVFDPLCGCGHMLSEHTWGTPPQPWGCVFCVCSLFGADVTGTVERKERAEIVLPPPPPKPLPPKPAPVVNTAETDIGKVSWGRRPVDLFDCGSINCPEKATYWTSRNYLTSAGRSASVKKAYCPPHFRQWANRYIPSAQLSLF
jgi:hypothetical protein